MSEERYLSLERDNQQLREEVARLRGSESEDRGPQLEQLRQQVHTLTSKLAAQRAAGRQSKVSLTDTAQQKSRRTFGRQQTALWRCGRPFVWVSRAGRPAVSADAAVYLYRGRIALPCDVL